MRGTDTISISMTRTEALALAKVADIGLRVVEALSLIQSTAAAETALRLVNQAANRSK